MPSVLGPTVSSDDGRMFYDPFEGYRFRFTLAVDRAALDRARGSTPGMRALVDYGYWNARTTQAVALGYLQQQSRSNVRAEMDFACLLHALDVQVTDAIIRGVDQDVIAKERYFTFAMEHRPERHEIIASMYADYDLLDRAYLIEITTRGVPREEDRDDAPLNLDNVPADVVDWAKGAIRFAVGRTARRLTFRRKKED